MTKASKALGLVVVVLGVAAAQASLVQLYSLEDTQTSGATSTTRGQRFSPTEATPNGLSGTGSESFFDAAALGIGVREQDNLVGTLYLYNWNTDYSTSIAGAALGSTPVNLTGPGSGEQTTWLDVVPAAPLAAASQYLLHLQITGWTSPTSTPGWYLERSNSDDGGPNNQAFNNGSPASSREYGVQLNAIPEPATLSLLGLAALTLLRRRR